VKSSNNFGEKMTPDNHDFDQSIFINCPFDKEYKPMLRVLLFTVIDCGFEPRIATERGDSGEVRIEKIKDLIKQSRYSIHDISRMEALKEGDLPRFNMPFELGLDLGCRAFGSGNLSEKKCLILEKERYRYQKVLSDISGNDIEAHNSNPEILVRRVRNWVYETTNHKVSSGTIIWRRYSAFYNHFEIVTGESAYDTEDIEEMPDIEFIDLIKEWGKSTSATA